MNEALWLLGRGLGVSTLVLLTISMVAGIITWQRSTPLETPRFAVAEIHRRASLVASGLLVAHILSLVLDQEAQLSWVDTVVPFLNARNPLWWGLGTLSLDILLVVVVTSLLKKRISHRVWRGIHWFSYLAWPVAVLHAFGGGTDATTVWFRLIAFTSIAAVGAAVGIRLNATPATAGAARRAV
ncbi:MAG: ferric reductase-like transmembrane domain-containing protein [Dermatophilaceae bacterium]